MTPSPTGNNRVMGLHPITPRGLAAPQPPQYTFIWEGFAPHKPPLIVKFYQNDKIKFYISRLGEPLVPLTTPPITLILHNTPGVWGFTPNIRGS